MRLRFVAVAIAAVATGCSGSGGSAAAPAAPSAPAIAGVALTFGTPVAGPPAAVPVGVHAYRADGTEFTAAYPEPVTVTLDTACNFALGTSLSAVATTLALLPVDPGPTCPNVAGSAPPPTVSVSAAGAAVYLAGNGGFVPSGPFLTVSAAGVVPVSYVAIATGVSGPAAVRRR